ncbi:MULTISPECIES: hypothetical protein [unclassified Cryobacterium]|uniref:hypothetical protein n=1 Tax=unclassified Cryobacterium TaxID=2649013 RepID=UPI0013048B36|nr:MULTISPECIES: hypothetical protein [unclassified Cryobacterium]
MNYVRGELRHAKDPIRLVRLWMLLPLHTDATVHDEPAADGLILVSLWVYS